MKTEIQKTKVLNERLITIESCNHGMENEASLELIKNLEELIKVNQALKDRNEELEINMLSIPLNSNNKAADEEKTIKRKVQHNSESPKLSPKIKWSKKSDFIDVDTISSLSDECEEILSLSDVDCNIEISSGTMEYELDHVKMEIMKMISEKKQAGGKENEKVKEIQNKVFHLEQENKNLKQTIKDLHHSMKLNLSDSHQEKLEEVDDTIPDILVEQINCIDRSSPDGQEREEDIIALKKNENIKASEEKIEQLNINNKELQLSNSKLLEEKK